MRVLMYLFVAFLASPAMALSPADQLEKPPADSKIWSITSNGGASRNGQVAQWTAPDGTRWCRMDFNLRGLVTQIDEQKRFAADGSLIALAIRGTAPDGDAAETYEVNSGIYSFTSPVDKGKGKVMPNLAYVPFGGTLDSFAVVLDQMLKAPNHSVELLPSGRGSLAPLTTLDISNGTAKKTITAYAITGFDLSPTPVWMDGDNFFGSAGVITTVPEGWESAGPEMIQAQDAALAKLAPGIVAAIAKTPAGPVVFKNVKLYDADARRFRDSMTVVVIKGRITSVGPASEIKAPADAQIIDGAGKTLIPGLWDNHQHYGDDFAGPLLLASGITSVRDPGNLPEPLMARKKRIDQGQLLGPRIVPSLLIDGPGPLTAQVAVVVSNMNEALAAVHRAKNGGYFAIKLYGSLDPQFVKPMADLAHQLGLRVHGHVPHGMRPLDAVRAGYDEITHINFVMMQAMPENVVQTSNGMNRFIGMGKYSASVDLRSKAMADYLDELAQRRIAVDPTLVTFEDLYVPDRGTYPPAVAPYAATLPSQFARGFLSAGLAPTPELSREEMRASFAKLKGLIPELNRRHIEILAGTDGIGFELVRELELYVESGLTPADALATATIIPARAYHLGDQTGSVATGKLAELALINGDPSKSIADLRQVELIMRDGKMMTASDLRATLGISGAPKR